MLRSIILSFILLTFQFHAFAETEQTPLSQAQIERSLFDIHTAHRSNLVAFARRQPGVSPDMAEDFVSDLYEKILIEFRNGKISEVNRSYLYKKLGWLIKDHFQKVSVAKLELVSTSDYLLNESELWPKGLEDTNTFKLERSIEALELNEPRSYEFLVIMAGGSSLKEAAKIMGVNVRTAQRYKATIQEFFKDDARVSLFKRPNKLPRRKISNTVISVERSVRIGSRR